MCFVLASEDGGEKPTSHPAHVVNTELKDGKGMACVWYRDLMLHSLATLSVASHC